VGRLLRLVLGLELGDLLLVGCRPRRSGGRPSCALPLGQGTERLDRLGFGLEELGFVLGVELPADLGRAHAFFVPLARAAGRREVGPDVPAAFGLGRLGGALRGGFGTRFGGGLLLGPAGPEERQAGEGAGADGRVEDGVVTGNPAVSQGGESDEHQSYRSLEHQDPSVAGRACTQV
jgi:hypothetical protein